MTRPDLPVLGVLLVFGVFIWTRDLRWTDVPGDTLPILAALPLFWFLRRPWVRRGGGYVPLFPGRMVLAAILFLVGMAADSVLFLALAWTCFLWAWVAAVFAEPARGSTAQLLLLPLLAFPWLQTDLETLAWWFRLSGAAATETVLQLAGVPVERDGTMLWCNGLGVSVEAACSGVNGLQTMLVLGGAVAYLKLRGSPAFWWNLPVLVAAAWLANWLRILAAAMCGAFLPPETAADRVGPIHDVAGWVALVAAFLLCHALFSWQERALASRRRRSPAALRRSLPAEALVLAYAVFCARGLWETWRWTPFDRLAGWAFAIWLLPIVWSLRQAPGRRSLRTAGTAAVLLLIASATDINAIAHAGLAVAIAAFHRIAGRWLWLAAALAWMPAAGWLGSRLVFSPEQFAVVRLAVAALAAAWSIVAEMRQQTAASTELLLAAAPRPAR